MASVGLGALSFQKRPNTLLLIPVFVLVEFAGEVGRSEPQQVRRQRVAFVVVDDALMGSVQPQLGNCASVDVHLAGNSRERRHLMQ